MNEEKNETRAFTTGELNDHPVCYIPRKIVHDEKSWAREQKSWDWYCDRSRDY